MKQKEKQIVLASASPRRLQLLKACGLRFKVKPSRANEDTVKKRPHAIVTELALRKAQSTAAELRDGLVIGADTIVVVRGDIVGKPKDRADAMRILSNLSGSCHRVYTGVAVVDAASGKSRVTYEVSRVKMRRLPPEELETLASKHLDKAGAYAVQETEDAFVEWIEGDYFNVVGLPLKTLDGLLRRFGARLPKIPAI